MFQWATMRKASTNLFLILVLALLSTLPGRSDTEIYTIYDDQSSSIVYSGSWQSASSGFPNAWLGSEHYTNVQGDTASLAFNGASITYVYAMHNNRGIANIYIDNVLKEQVSLYIAPGIPTAWQMSKTYTVPAGNHTIEVEKNPTSGYIDLDRLIVDTPSLGNGTYDNPVSQFNYFGTWSSGNFSNAYGGTDKWTNTPESGVTFTFTGDTVTYVYTKHPNRGKAKIYIDGIGYADVDLSLPTGSATQWQQSTTYTNLSSGFGGIHTIHISVGGAGQAGGTYIDVDAIIVGYNSTGIGTPNGCEPIHYYYCTKVSYVSLPTGRRVLQRWYGGATAANTGSSITSWRLNSIKDYNYVSGSYQLVEQWTYNTTYNNNSFDPTTGPWYSNTVQRDRTTPSQVRYNYHYDVNPPGLPWGADIVRNIN